MGTGLLLRAGFQNEANHRTSSCNPRQVGQNRGLRVRATKGHKMQVSEIRLDVRSMPPAERHQQIFSLFEGLTMEQALLVISDHEPRPLHAQFEQRFPGGFSWQQRCLSEIHWEVAIRRIASVRGDANLRTVIQRSMVFSHFSSYALDEIVPRARTTLVKRHSIVVDQGINWPYLGVVETGLVQAILATSAGRDQLVYDVLPGEVLGETSFIDGGTIPLRYLALLPETRIILIPSDVVYTIMHHDTILFQKLSRISAQRLRATIEQFGAVLSLSVISRLARALLAYAPPGSELLTAFSPLRHMTQVELALLAGSVKEVVSRAIAALEDAGALERERGRIVRLNRARLTTIALGQRCTEPNVTKVANK